MAAKIYRINYKSDFILTLESDAGWMTPFCIKFWTGAPSQAYFIGWDGETYTHCTYDPSEPTKLQVQFDDHHLPIGDLKFQIAYHFTVADFPDNTEDEVINPANITTEIDGETYQVMLDFTGETAPEIEFSLPAYANEAQRIANEEQRIAHEAIRIVNEESRIAAETIRQQNEAQRIAQETARVNEFATLKSQSQAATSAANTAATLANDKAQLAADKAALAQAAATLANEKAQLAADKAALANAAAQLANEKAALAQQKAEYAQQQGGYAKNQGDYAKNKGDYAKEQGDYAKEQGDYAKRKGDDAAAQMQQQAQAFSEAQAARQTAYEQAEGTESGSVAGDGSRWGTFKTNEAARDAKVDAKVADITNLQEAVAEGAVYDVSAKNPTAGPNNDGKWGSLSALLSDANLNTLIPSAVRRGGMSIKFVLTSDNMYVQYRLMLSTFTAAQFVNPANWQGVDDVPTAGSDNLVKSGGVALKDFSYDMVIGQEADMVNLFDKTKVLRGYYVNRNNGKVSNINASSYFTTDFIPISSAGAYAGLAVIGGSYFGYACYSAAREPSDGDATFTHGGDPRQATYQEGDAYVRFSGLLTNIDSFMVVAGTSEDYPSSYYPYGAKNGYVKDGVIGSGSLKDGSVTHGKVANDAVLANNMGDTHVFTDYYNVVGDTVKELYILEKYMTGITSVKVYSYLRFIIRGYVDNTHYWGCEHAYYSENKVVYPLVCTTAYGSTAVGDVVGYIVFNDVTTFNATNDGSGFSADMKRLGRLTENPMISFMNPPKSVGIDSIADDVTLQALSGKIEAGQIDDDAVSLDNVSFRTFIAGKNKLNPAKITEGKYINKNTGQEASGDNIACTDFIQVSKDGLYCNYGYYGGVAIGGCAYDSNKSNPRSIGTDGKVYTYQEGDAYVRFSLYHYDLSNAYVIEGTVAGEYTPYTEREVISPDVLPPTSVTPEEFIQKAEENMIFSQEIDVFIPDKIYAVVGDTLQLFFQPMAKCVDVSPYNTLVACNKGSQYRRYFQFTPKIDDVGIHSFKFFIKDSNGNVLGQGNSSIIAVGTPTSPSSNVNVLCVGDSITDDGEWPAEMKRRLTGSDGNPVGNGLSNITFVGSIEKRSVHFEGNSGYAWYDYATRGRAAFRFTIGEGVNVTNGDVYSNNGHEYTVIEVSYDNTIRCSTSNFNNTPTASGTLTKVSGSGDETIAFTESAEDSRNPFWDADNSKLSFTKYATQYCGGSIDVIYVLLGGNALFSDQMSYVRDFIDAYHTDFPNGKVKLMGMYVPSMKLMMPGYGASGSNAANTYSVLCKLKDQARSYQELANDDDYSSFVEYIDIACQLDSDYNFPVTQKAVNTRNNSVTEPYANNAIHASESGGYMQIADAAYRNFVANYCQV